MAEPARNITRKARNKPDNIVAFDPIKDTPASPNTQRQFGEDGYLRSVQEEYPGLLEEMEIEEEINSNIIRQARNNQQAGLTQDEVATATVPDIPFFPITLFISSLAKDCFDLLDLTLVGIIFTTIFSFIIWVVVAWWLLGKGNFIQKYIFKRLIWPIIIIMCADFLPIIKIISGPTILVLLVHRKERNISRELRARFSIFKKRFIEGDSDMTISKNELKNAISENKGKSI